MFLTYLELGLMLIRPGTRQINAKLPDGKLHLLAPVVK